MDAYGLVYLRHLLAHAPDVADGKKSARGAVRRTRFLTSEPAIRRVLVVLRCGQIGGMERYVIDIVAALVQAGHTVRVLLTNKRREDVPQFFTDTMDRLGADVVFHYFSITKPDAKFYNRDFAGLLGRLGVDVVFFNRSGGGGWSKFADLITTARLKGISKIVVSEHGHPPPFPTHKGNAVHVLRKRIHCWLQAHCLNATICMNRQARVQLLEGGYGYPRKRTHVVYNGVDTSKFQFDPELRQACREAHGIGSKTMVLYCGRMSFEKGAEVLLRAWARIGAEARKDLVLYYVGGGAKLDELQALSSELGLSGSVTFLGFQEDVLRYLCASDIFVLPSHMESFGLSLAEAMAVERYVVASRVGGIPELLCEPGVGTLIDPDSPGQLADAIMFAAANPDMRETVGRAARALVCKRFSLDRTQQRTMNILTDPDAAVVSDG